MGVPLNPPTPTSHSRETAALALSCRGHTAEVTSGSSSIHRLALSLPFCAHLFSPGHSPGPFPPPPLPLAACGPHTLLLSPWVSP